MTHKIRADQLVFEQGLAESREKAKSLIMAARVTAGGQLVQKPGQFFFRSTIFELVPGKQFVSRGAYKLLTLLENFNIDVTDLVCLDAGASTGGFTDCLLQRGASRVYAVDVGTNQLHERLRADPRVVSMENVNLRYAPPDLLPEKVDLITGDLSFISLTLVLPSCIPWLKSNGLLATLIKPQFELSPADVPKGVVRSDEARQMAVRKITDFCISMLGLEPLGVVPAKIKGPKGNQEFMALFRLP